MACRAVHKQAGTCVASWRRWLPLLILGRFFSVAFCSHIFATLRSQAAPVFRGEKRIALCVSEPTAGSDVANLSTTAIEDGEGNYIVNGLKKWITCGVRL